MGGRGSYASGCKVHEYETIGTIHGVKVVRKIKGANKVPEESYHSNSYMTLYSDGKFQRLRYYDEKHNAKLDIEYHKEQNKFKNRNILHIHEYKNGVRQPSRMLTETEYNKYQKYFIGIEK